MSADKPNPHPTPNRVTFARDVRRKFVVRVEGHWHNTVSGWRVDDLMRQFGDLIEPREDAEGLTRAALTEAGEAWLDTYGKNGAHGA